MGCCVQSKVSDFVRASNKIELRGFYNHEINRIKLLRSEIKVDMSKKEDRTKIFILDKILHEDSWLILLIVQGCEEEHVLKLKFLLSDYFMVTENWNKKEFEDNYVKIRNFYKDNKEKIIITEKSENE